MPHDPGSDVPESINLFLTAHLETESLVATGRIVRVKGGWMIVFQADEPDDAFCVFTPDERSRFARWIVGHFRKRPSDALQPRRPPGR